jgi:hypothetical protein
MGVDRSFTIFSPVGIPRNADRSEAGKSRPLGTLAGKRIGLLDDGVTEAFFRRLESLLMTKWEVGSVGYHRKPEMTAPAPNSLLDEVAASYDGVVIGTAV